MCCGSCGLKESDMTEQLIELRLSKEVISAMRRNTVRTG